MEPRLSFVTLAVPDLKAVRAFYVDGLGWTPELEVPDEVIMIRLSPGLILSLWSAAAFAEEVGPVSTGANAPMTLAHNVATPEQVDEVLDQAAAAGARAIRPGSWRDWGGYSGYAQDPAGFWWEIAYNPAPIGGSLLP